MKAEIFSHFSRVLDDLIDRYDFCKYYFQNPFSLYNDVYDNGLKLCCGATRGCIVEDDYNWVIKFDLAESGINTCGKELAIYKDAMEWDIANFFAEPIYLGTYCRTFDFYDVIEFDSYYDDITICGFENEDFERELKEKEEEEKTPITIELPLYAYPHANPFYPEGILDVEKARKELGVSPLTERNIVVGYEFAKAYDADEYDLLVSFLEEEGVNDLHCGNIGTIAGKPILIDYCGYSEEDY